MAADHASILDGTINHTLGKILKLRPVRDLGAPVPLDSSEHLLLGFAGQAAIRSVVRRHLVVTTPTLSADAGELDRWADGVAEDICALAVDARPTITDADGHVDVIALLVYRDRLWLLAQQLTQPVLSGVAAIGSGGDLALGYLTGALNNGAHPAAALADAVKVACRHDDGCGLYPGMGPALEVLTAHG
jgi:hypothetical protein